MTDAEPPRYGSTEHEQERQRRNRERFLAELNGWVEPPPPDVRPKDIPFVMCGMCNTYPARWNASGWKCGKIQDTVEPGYEACERWTPREEWKPDPPMYSMMSDRPNYDYGVPRCFEPNLAPAKAAEQARDFPSYVYFIRCGEYVKIGFSESPRSRLSSIATTTPLPVEIIGLVQGTLADERQLHERFKELRHKLEWFLLTDQLREEIRKISGSEKKWRALLKRCDEWNRPSPPPPGL